MRDAKEWANDHTTEECICRSVVIPPCGRCREVARVRAIQADAREDPLAQVEALKAGWPHGQTCWFQFCETCRHAEQLKDNGILWIPKCEDSGHNRGKCNCERDAQIAAALEAVGKT